MNKAKISMNVRPRIIYVRNIVRSPKGTNRQTSRIGRVSHKSEHYHLDSDEEDESIAD